MISNDKPAASIFLSLGKTTADWIFLVGVVLVVELVFPSFGLWLNDRLLELFERLRK